MKNFIVDLKDDFDQKVYLFRMEMSKKFLHQFEQDVMLWEATISKDVNYTEKFNETNYNFSRSHHFAQRNIDCIRAYDCIEKNQTFQNFRLIGIKLFFLELFVV